MITAFGLIIGTIIQPTCAMYRARFLLGVVVTIRASHTEELWYDCQVYGDLWENPLGTDGFEFVEYASPMRRISPSCLHGWDLPPWPDTGARRSPCFVRETSTSFSTLNPTVRPNASPPSMVPVMNAIAFRVRDAAQALHALVAGGAQPVEIGCWPIRTAPAIEGIGGSLICLVDRYGDQTIYDVDFRPLAGVDQHPHEVGLTVDHLTHNVERGNWRKWAAFYERHFPLRNSATDDIGEADRATLSRHDQPLWQNSHSDQ